MKVDLYERIWMWGTGAMLAVFFATVAYGALRADHRPPSHVETIDPSSVMKDPRFATQGVRMVDGRVHVWVVALSFTFLPAELTIPAGTPITFHVTSIDVTHGFQIVRTNGQSMVLPGYISQFTTEFEPGEYLIACNEYCGLSHHTMAGKLHVVPRGQWTPPKAAASATALAPTTTEARHEGH
jgi:cytochrome c oxidase subunit II